MPKHLPKIYINVDINTVALWRFNESFGNIVVDETGTNNGTVVGTSIIDGKFGKARYFNGSSDYITVPDNPSLNNFSQITIEAWVYPTGFDLGYWANAEDIVSKGVDSNQGYVNGYNLRIGRNQEGWCAGASSFNQVNFSASIKSAGASSPLWYTPNQWYYVAFAYDGNYLSFMLFYVNGVLTSISNYAPNLIVSNTYPLYINHHLFGGGYQSSQRMQGLIDEIRISNIARPAEEIAYYYNLATSPQMIKPTIDGRIVCGFGCYINKKTGRPHEGIDIDKTLYQTPVKVSAPGTVIYIDQTDDSKNGKWIWIYHDNVIKLDGIMAEKISTRYLHLDSIDPNLSVGQKITQGTIIGTVGKTGATTPHLHFEVRQGDIPIDFDFSKTVALNPLDFVDYIIPALSISAFSPVDFFITDPDGFVVSKSINDLQELAEYFEVKYTGPDNGEALSDYDSVIIDQRKEGDYLVTVVPELNAFPEDTYTLKAISTTTALILAENILVKDISDQPYIIRSIKTGIEKVTPAKVRIEPETLNLANIWCIYFTVFIRFSKGFGVAVKDINPETVRIEDVPVIRTMMADDKFIVKFNVQDFPNLPTGDSVKLKVAGRLLDGSAFEGYDTIRIIKNK